MSAELATLAADPSRLEDLDRDRLPELIGEVESLKAALWARLQTLQAPAPAAAPGPSTNGSQGSGRLLTADQVADRLGVDRRWVYRHADDWSFARRLSPNTLRFDERGLERWMESR